MLVIGWHGELEVTGSDGGVAESDAEHLSYPLSNHALSCRLATEPAIQRSWCAIPTIQTATHSSSSPPKDDGDTVDYDVALTICGIVSNN